MNSEIEKENEKQTYEGTKKKAKESQRIKKLIKNEKRPETKNLTMKKKQKKTKDKRLRVTRKKSL